jgi:hypothetical protein
MFPSSLYIGGATKNTIRENSTELKPQMAFMNVDMYILLIALVMDPFFLSQKSFTVNDP